MDGKLYDLLIIGGGINGAGVARDAAGRGLSVILCEQDDLGAFTSSASTKLIHGGLRYLEHYAFRLVRESLAEREILLRIAPHLVQPLRFVMPEARLLRPAWLIRLGLLLYDRMGGRRTLEGSARVDLADHPYGRALKGDVARAFVYSDCTVDDSRLVVLNTLDAAERGAVILPRTAFVSAEKVRDRWRAVVRPASDDSPMAVESRAIVNAGGPWAAQILAQRLGLGTRRASRLVKGSHIVVPRAYEGRHAYVFQNADRRIVFAIPYAGDFTLIGTTDVDFEGDPASATISTEEIEYLCRSVSAYLAAPVAPDKVVWRYAGVRALIDDPALPASEASRDYGLDLAEVAGAPLLSILGGKLTTYRKLAEQAVDRLLPLLGRSGAAWTASTPLPGGDTAGRDVAALARALTATRPWLPAELAHRYAAAYGTRAERLLGGITAARDLGSHLGGGLFECEARYLMREEWARTPDDILWRRTKLGLRLSPNERNALADWMAGERVSSPARP
ncbi:MAG: glycerol-3-phosphate dehydrogenase [Rhodospirillales bacterium]|nr:glycerol-3-phosphate dehydrogenase [Rhodospirillales bacterium]